MNGHLPLAHLVDTLDAIERIERRFADQVAGLKQKQQEEMHSSDIRLHSDIDESKRLGGSLEKIQHAITLELRKAGLETAAVASAPPADIPSNPKLEDLATLLRQVGKRSVSLESNLRELEHYRELQLKAAHAVHALKARPAIPAAPRLITVPPPSFSQPAPVAPPAKTASPLTLIIVSGLAALAIGLLLYYLFYK